MPITTYARLEDMLRTEDPDIVEALSGLPTTVIVKEVPLRAQYWHWWRQRERLDTGYSVLWFVGDTLLGPEWQVVNFYCEDTDTSINTVVSKALVLAYVYGIAAGQHHTVREVLRDDHTDQPAP